MSEYKNQIRAEREKQRIETVIDWLFVPEGERRHTFLSHAERMEYYKSIVEKVALNMPQYIQERLLAHWIGTVVNKKRDKEAAKKLLEKAGQELYSPRHLELWAESLLIKKGMKVTPKAMAVMYAVYCKHSPTMAGIFVRDMQRVKARMVARHKRTGSLAKIADKDHLQRPRYRKTLVQEEKYRKRMKQGTVSGEEQEAVSGEPPLIGSLPDEVAA